jgi:hypothetical protein
MLNGAQPTRKGKLIWLVLESCPTSRVWGLEKGSDQQIERFTQVILYDDAKMTIGPENLLPSTCPKERESLRECLARAPTPGASLFQR